MIEQVWQWIITYKNELIIAAIVGFVIGLSVFLMRSVLCQIWLRVFGSTEKKKQQNERLKEHFRDIKIQAESIISQYCGFTEYAGVILINRGIKNTHRAVNVLQDDLSEKQYSSLNAHFPKDISKLNNIRQLINEHNYRRFQEFQNKVIMDFQSRGLTVVHDSSTRASYIFGSIMVPLFQWWKSLQRQSNNPWPDFKVISTRPHGGTNNLYVKGYDSTAIAFARSYGGKRKCINAIKQVANNEEYKQQAKLLILETDILLVNIEGITNELKEKLDIVERYWPGTRSYKFKKEKRECQKCKEIFG